MCKDNVLLLANCFFLRTVKIMELNSSLAGARYTRSAEKNLMLINFTAFKTQVSLFQDTL